MVAKPSVGYQKRVSVIVLAAGLSSRMGNDNKLLLNVDGQPLIRKTMNTLTAHDFTEIIVVLGHEAEQVSRAIADFNLVTLYNPDFLSGQMTSVHCGMRSLSKVTDGVMVFLADLALIDQQDLDELRSAFDNCNTGVLVPTFEGQRGNPIILDYKQRQGIVAGDKNLGCKRLISKHPELVTVHPMSNDHVVMDMDTPEAYKAITHRLSRSTDPGSLTSLNNMETA